MVATHVLDERTPTGALARAQWLAGGRASALFAVLAGVSLALMTGRTEPVRGPERVVRSIGLGIRAVLIAVLGLVLGSLESGIAVILTYYGLLFLLGIPFLGLRARTLALIAAGWVVVGPVLSWWAGGLLPERGYASPHLSQLARPGHLAAELLFTGYYPVVPWLAYLLAGLAVGRMPLRRRSVQAALLVGGVALAVVATVVSHALVTRDGIARVLLTESGAPRIGVLLDQISTGMFGNVPRGGAWQWLLVVAPHSSTPFDVLQTGGSALAVIGGCLLVVGLLPRAALIAVSVFFGAGAMTLTLYTLHVVMRTPDVWPQERPDTFVVHVLVVLGIGAVFAALGRRGPLEALIGRASSLDRAGSGTETA